MTDPKTIPTEVFLLPAASAVEKDGSFTNTERMIQWHDRAVLPPGDCRSDSWFAYDLGKRLKELYNDSPLERDASLRHLTWNYDGGDLRIEGRTRHREGAAGDQRFITSASGGNCAGRLSSPAMARPPAGAGCIAEFSQRRGRTGARSKGNQLRGTSVYGDWSWTWPENRRILYNRASADPQGPALVGTEEARVVGRSGATVDRP